ncbi:MAG: NAD(+)/NADH kinase, partial [bacterium]
MRLLEVGLTHSAADTQAAAIAARDAGCGVIVSLGGDGTNRAIAGVCPEVPLLPRSTGTNNVFPVMVEATSAGVAAGLVAAGIVPVAEAARRSRPPAC